MNLVNSPREFLPLQLYILITNRPAPNIHDNSALLFPSYCQAAYHGISKAILAGIIGHGGSSTPKKFKAGSSTALPSVLEDSAQLSRPKPAMRRGQEPPKEGMGQKVMRFIRRADLDRSYMLTLLSKGSNNRKYTSRSEKL
jgi:hypothetical protein